MSTTSKMSARQRIEFLLDPESFLETGSLVRARSTDFNLQSEKTTEDGVITGCGLIDGRLVFVYSQDASVLGGSVGEMHAQKIVRLYEQAARAKAPVIAMIDSSGMRLHEASDALNGLGMIFASQVRAKGVVAQITAVFGNCGGGLCEIAALSDFTFMENSARLFVNPPDVIKEDRGDKSDTAGADFQSSKTGLADFTGTEEDILTNIRSFISILPSSGGDDVFCEESDDDLNRVCHGLSSAVESAHRLLSEISDDHFYIEPGKDYAAEMTTAFIKLDGVTVGAVANSSAEADDGAPASAVRAAGLTADGCGKAARFIRFCDAFGIPLLTVVNVSGFDVSRRCAQKQLAQNIASLIDAYTSAGVAKVTLVTGNAYGTSYVAMGSKAIGADFVYAWPDAKIGMMDAKNAVRIIYDKSLKESGDYSGLLEEKTAEYESLQSNVYSAASRGYVDAVIEPENTRKYLIAAFETLFGKN